MDGWDAATHQSALELLLSNRTVPPSHHERAAALPVSGAQGQGMKERKEREEKERKRVQQLAEKAEKEKKRSEALRQLEIWSDKDNLLKRSTSDFVCKMKFFNTLPEPPVEPKLLDVQWPLERLVTYAPTSLERDYKHDILLGPSLGIPIDMVNPSAYMLPDEPGPLDPADEELLVGEKETLAKRDRRGQPKKQLSVPWLRKSEFITAVFDENLYNQSSGAQGAVRAAQAPSASSAKAAQLAFAAAGVAAVARQFVRANDGSRPVHPKDPSMVPVLVQPVLPCMEYVGHSLTHVLFAEPPVVERDAAEERRTALLLPLEIPGSNKMVVVRVLPNEADDLDDLFGAGDGGAGAGGGGGGEAEGAPKEYHKSQAHSADNIVNMAGKYVLLWGPGRATAEFVPFERKLELRELSFHFRGALPVVRNRFKVAKRAMTEEELEGAREAKRHVFAPVDEDEDEEDAGDGEVDLRELDDAADK